MYKATILGHKVKIEKWLRKFNDFEYLLKIQIGRSTFFVYFHDDDRNLVLRINFKEKQFAEYDQVGLLSEEEQKDVLDFVRFKVLFEAYEHALLYDFYINQNNTQQSNWSTGYDSLAYRKELRLMPDEPILGRYAYANLAIRCDVDCLFSGLKNYQADLSFRGNRNYLKIRIIDREDSIKSQLGILVKTKYLTNDDDNNLVGYRFSTRSEIAVRWFINKILPPYYMKAYIGEHTNKNDFFILNI